MSVIIDEFEKVCKKNSQKVAFYYERKGKVCSKTYAELYDDVEKAVGYLVKKGVKGGGKLLAFASPDYNLLVCMLASFKLGAMVMYVDIFAKQDSLKNFFDRFKPDFVLVSNKTQLIKPFFKCVRKVRVVNVDKFLIGSVFLRKYDIDDSVPALITATTGSSSRPKVFIRTNRDLFNQLILIRNNMKTNGQDEVILTTSYIYAFANLIQGFTTVLPNINLGLNKRVASTAKKLKLFDGVGITTIITSPDFCLRLPNLYSGVKQLYFGGAILNYNEANEIQLKYAESKIWYIYGSTECALISWVRLDEYLDTLKSSGRCLLGDICSGVKVRVNENGHILIKSDALLRRELGGRTKEEYYDINDIGSIDNGRLYYIGKNGTMVNIKEKKYCANEIEQQIILKYHGLSKCAVLEYRGINYVFFEGVVNLKEMKKYLIEEFGIKNVVNLRQIPRDVKHHTKIDYAKLKYFCEKYFSR